VQLVRVPRVEAHLVSHPGDRGGVERAERAGGRRLGGATCVDRLRPPLLERRVVEKRVRPRVEDFVRQR
jgi:hypothetical protein